MTEIKRLDQYLDPEITHGDLRKVLLAVVTESLPWNVFARARVPFAETISALRALQRGGWLLFQNNSIGLTNKGAKLANELGVEPLPNYVCSNCESSGMSGLEQQDFFQRFCEIFEKRPHGENPEFDQTSMTPLSLARRLSWMIYHGDVTRRRVVVLGDDDYLSIALALSHLPARVTILEIDSRICDFIRAVSIEEQLTIQVVNQDLTALLPVELHGAFDTFACDPPESEKGMLLFLEKGLSLLASADNRAGYFGVTTLESTAQKWARWQRHLVNYYDLAITNILPPFTEYLNWVGQKPMDGLASFAHLPKHPWYRSWLYRIETTKNFVPPADFESPFEDAFMFDNEGYYRSWDELSS